MARNPKKAQFSSLPAYGVLVESHVHGAEFRTAVHAHPYHSLLYVVSGAGQCTVGQRSHELTANTTVLLRANEPHQLIDRPRKAMTVFVVYFSQALAKAAEQLVEPLLAEPKILSIPAHQAQRTRRTLRQMLHEQDAKAAKYDLAMQQYLSSILLTFYRADVETKKSVGTNIKEGSESRVRGVLKYVTEQYYEPQSLSSAAKMAKLSQRHFSNICRRLTGMSFVKYVNKLRIQKAEALLKETDRPVTAIAFGVGFEELSSFYRAFRKCKGVPPLVFRRSCKQERGKIVSRVFRTFVL